MTYLYTIANVRRPQVVTHFIGTRDAIPLGWVYVSRSPGIAL